MRKVLTKQKEYVIIYTEKNKKTKRKIKIFSKSFLRSLDK